jgi:hypothetical protein
MTVREIIENSEPVKDLELFCVQRPLAVKRLLSVCIEGIRKVKEAKMQKLKEENSLVKHALFLIKELSATLKLLNKEDFSKDLKEEMRNVSQDFINDTL